MDDWIKELARKKASEIKRLGEIAQREAERHAIIEKEVVATLGALRSTLQRYITIFNNAYPGGGKINAIVEVPGREHLLEFRYGRVTVRLAGEPSLGRVRAELLDERTPAILPGGRQEKILQATLNGDAPSVLWTPEPEEFCRTIFEHFLHYA